MSKFNVIDAIIDYESGQMGDEETITFFQYLVDTGLAWTLQGNYGRMAIQMINAGDVIAPTRR